MSVERALALRRRGLSVFPVPRPRPGALPGKPGDGKTPALAWGPYRDRLPTEDELELPAWFGGPPMNLAVITGALSGVVVVDADSLEGLRWCTAHLPYTPWQTKTARSFHLWYGHPGVHVPNKTGLDTGAGRLAIDVRGDGGYVIAPGSMHASGTEYREAGDWTVPRDQLPRFWPGWVRRPARLSSPRPDTPRPTGDLIERARRYLAAVPRPEIGCGSDAATLYAACRLVRGFALGAADAETLLWEWAGGHPGFTREWVAAKVANASRYGSETIGGLR